MCRFTKMGVLFNLLIATAILAPATSARAGGTRPTFLRNATADPNVAFAVDGGRGLDINLIAADGGHAQFAPPGAVLTADQTNAFDCPTLRVYRKNEAGQWICVCARKVSYIPIPIFGGDDTNRWKWTGSELLPE